MILVARACLVTTEKKMEEPRNHKRFMAGYSEPATKSTTEQDSMVPGNLESGPEKAASPTDKESSPFKEVKRKGPCEVPDVSCWGTSSSLYERVRVQSKPEVAEALCTYREAIMGIPRKHPRNCVTLYD